MRSDFSGGLYNEHGVLTNFFRNCLGLKKVKHEFDTYIYKHQDNRPFFRVKEEVIYLSVHLTSVMRAYNIILVSTTV